jgi:hypothetical protein
MKIRLIEDGHSPSFAVEESLALIADEAIGTADGRTVSLIARRGGAL